LRLDWVELGRRDTPLIESPVVTKRGLVLNNTIQGDECSQQPAHTFIQHL